MASSEVLSFERTGDATVVLRLSGSWSLQSGLPSVAEVEGYVVSAPRPMGISFDTRGLTIWDSSLLTFLSKVAELCQQQRITMDRSGLPSGVRRLLDLAELFDATAVAPGGKLGLEKHLQDLKGQLPAGQPPP